MARSKVSTLMYDHYCAWKSSGFSQRKYSKQNGLRVAQFNYWVCKFRREQSPAVIEESGFVPLIVTSNDTTPVFELNHSNGHRISFYQLVDVSFIKALLG